MFAGYASITSESCTKYNYINCSTIIIGTIIWKCDCKLNARNVNEQLLKLTITANVYMFPQNRRSTKDSKEYKKITAVSICAH